MKKTLPLMIIAVAGVSHGQITNGSFETNTWGLGKLIATELDATTSSIDSTVTVSSWDMNKNGIMQTKNAGVGTSDANYAAVLNTTNDINQDFSFSVPGTYTVFYDTFTDPKLTTGFTTSLGAALGTLASSSAVESGADSAWTSRSLTFNITDTTPVYSLYFINDYSTKDPGFLYIDNVSIKPVPEPSSALLGGLAGLMLLRRRRVA